MDYQWVHFVEWFEEQTINSAQQKPVTWVKYVEYIFIIWRGLDELNIFAITSTNNTPASEETEAVETETIKEVGHKLRKINELDNEINLKDRVSYYEEIFLDSDALNSISEYLKNTTIAIDMSKNYDPLEFAGKITDTLDIREKKDLLKLNDFINDIRTVAPVPTFHYTYGTFEFNQERPVKQKKERLTQREQFTHKAPEQVATLEKDELNIEDIVNGLYKVLVEEFVKNNEEPIKYYDYVIDTDDFGSTIENIFHFSFLIRNGKAQLDLDGDGDPIIKPITKSFAKQYRNNEGVNFQIISSINYEEWNKYRKPGFIQKHKSTIKKRKRAID